MLSSFRLPFKEDKVFGMLVLICLLIPLAFTMNTYEHYETVKLSLLLILTGSAVVMLVRQSRQRSFRGVLLQGQKPLLVLLVLFWLFATLATVWSLDRSNSVFGFYPRISNGWIFFTIWLLFVASCFAVLNRKKYEFLLKVLVLTGAIVALDGLLQSVGIGYYNGPASDAFQRAPSLLGNPNFSTMYVTLLLPFSLWFLLEAKDFVWKIYYALISFIIIWSVVILASRGALLALFAVLGVNILGIAIYKLPRHAFVWFVASLLLTLGLTYGFTQLTRPNTITAAVKLQDSNIDQRFEVWSMAVKGIQGHPFGGVGLGNFQIFFSQNRDKHLASIEGVFDDAHNLFLQFAVTGGVQFAFTFILILLAACWYYYTPMARQRDFLALAGISSIVGFAVAANFTPVVIPCFIVLGLVIAGSGLYAARAVELRLPRGVAWSGAAMGIILAVMGLDFIVSEHVFFAARNAYLENNYKKGITLSRLAINLNPTNQLYYAYYAGNLMGNNPKDAQIDGVIQHMVAMHPTTPLSHSLAGTLYFRWTLLTNDYNHYQDSLKSMVTAINEDKFFPARYARIAYFFVRGNQLADAREALKANLTLDNSYIPAWVLLAKVYQLDNKQSQMAAALQEALKARPDIPDLVEMLKIAKTETDISKVPVPLAPESGSIE